MRLEHWFYAVPLRLRSLFRRRRVEREQPNGAALLPQAPKNPGKPRANRPKKPRVTRSKAR